MGLETHPSFLTRVTSWKLSFSANVPLLPKWRSFKDQCAPGVDEERIYSGARGDAGRWGETEWGIAAADVRALKEKKKIRQHSQFLEREWLTFQS